MDFKVRIPDIPKNEKVLKEYARFMELQGLKPITVNSKLWHLKPFFDFTGPKPARSITREDIENYIIHRRKNNKPNTVHKNAIEINYFFKWLIPGNVFFDGIKVKPEKNRLPVKNLIIQEDIKKAVAVCQTQRDRALVFFMWDSAARIGEVLNLKIGHVTFDRYGAVVSVEGKTGQRVIRVVDSVPDLQAWINQHPLREDPEAALFCALRGKSKNKRLQSRTVGNLFDTLKKEAGITKPFHPHMLRHGRLTDLVKQGFREMELRIYAGWEGDSKMPATYLHLSGEDVQKKILAINGLIDEEEKEKKEELKPRKCPRCQTENPYDSKYCRNCSMILDSKTAFDEERLKEAAKEHMDNEWMEVLIQKIKEEMGK